MSLWHIHFNIATLKIQSANTSIPMPILDWNFELLISSQ